MEILITAAPVLAGRAGQLATVLERIQDDPAGNPYLGIGKSELTHFVRLVLVPGPRSGEQRLLFVANFDGPIRAYLRELAELSPEMDELWGSCTGYAESAGFEDFVRRQYCKPRGVYVAFPGRSVAEIRNLQSARQQLEDLLDRLRNPGRSDGAELGRLLVGLAGLPGGTTAAGRAAAGLDRLWANALSAVRRADLRVLLKVAESFAEWGQATTFPRVPEPVAVDVDRQQAIQTAPVSGGIVQNQMTIVTSIRPERFVRLNVALAGTALLSRVGWPPGEFADVGTLHWFAWSVMDNGRTLLFLSVFDGSWQNYMQDFINKLVWGLDSLYSNTLEYPQAGMKDIPTFTNYIISHQFSPQVFYSGYPTETVVNLIRDRSIAAGLPTGPAAAKTRRWLQLL